MRCQETQQHRDTLVHSGPSLIVADLNPLSEMACRKTGIDLLYRLNKSYIPVQLHFAGNPP
ncbi:hypothetical protein D3C78_974830 [compost metagenome]